MPLKWINICMEFEIVSGICYALYLSIRSCHFPKIWPWSQGCTHCFPRTWRKWKGSLLVKYSPFLSQFPKPCFDGNTLTFLERRKTRELHSICYGLWIWEMAAQERERNIFSSLTAQFTALACVMKDGLTGGKHINLFNTSFMWSKSPWKQNKEIGKPLHFKVKFHNEGDNHAEVLDKEVGPRDDTLEYLVRPRDNTLEDLARPDGSGFFFCPRVFTDRLPFLQIQNLWNEGHGNHFLKSENTSGPASERRAEGPASASLSNVRIRVLELCALSPSVAFAATPEGLADCPSH